MSPSPAVTIEELEAILAREAFVQNYDFMVDSIAFGECTLKVPFRKEIERPGGVVCGPIFMAVADAAVWFAIKTMFGIDDASVTSELNTAFLKAAREEPVICTGKILKPGERLIYGTAECRNPKGEILTHHTVTYMRLKPRT